MSVIIFDTRVFRQFATFEMFEYFLFLFSFYGISVRSLLAMSLECVWLINENKAQYLGFWDLTAPEKPMVSMIPDCHNPLQD